MPLIPSDTNLLFEFQRIKFPIRLAFAITFSKSQGQTLDFVSIWLGESHVFTNGQLNVALSRISSYKKILIASDNVSEKTKNIVFKEIYRNA
jgi:hypothetical protein